MPRWTADEIRERGRRLVRRALEIWPRLDADPKMIRAMDTAELQARAARRGVEKVPMTPEAAELFPVLRDRLRSAFPDAIELAETRSVSYHDPEFFLEVIPRKRGLGLLIAIEYNEVVGPNGFAQDATDYTFVVNASCQGGVLINLRDETQIDRAVAIAGQARELISTG